MMKMVRLEVQPGARLSRLVGVTRNRWQGIGLMLAAALGAVVTIAGPAAQGAAAPDRLNPLVPYASFGWLPAGYTVGGGNGPQTSSTTRAVQLGAGSGTGADWVSLEVTAVGACSTRGSSSLPVLNCNYGTSSSGPTRAVSRAAAIHGRPAYWAADYGQGGSLIWEYAPGGWARLDLPSRAEGPPPASAHAMLQRIATSVRYGDTTAVKFPYWLTGVAASWPVAGTSYTSPPGGSLPGTDLTLQSAAGDYQVSLYIEPASSSTCPFIIGQSQYVTFAGASAVLRVASGIQDLCAPDLHGLRVEVSDLPDSADPWLPAASGPEGVLGIAHALHLIGADTAAWTIRPLR